MSDPATLWTVARQAPLSMGFPRQEYWSGLPCPPPGDLPDPGIESASPARLANSLPLSHQGSPVLCKPFLQFPKQLFKVDLCNHHSLDVKMKLREVQWFTQGHTAKKWQSHDSDLSLSNCRINQRPKDNCFAKVTWPKFGWEEIQTQISSILRNFAELNCS